MKICSLYRYIIHMYLHIHIYIYIDICGNIGNIVCCTSWHILYSHNLASLKYVSLECFGGIFFCRGHCSRSPKAKICQSRCSNLPLIHPQ